MQLPARSGPEIAWPAAPAEGTARGNLVLVHGKDENRSHMLSRANFIERNGYNMLAIDLRDHGGSGGWYITAGYLEARDILGAVGYLRQRGERAPIAILGHSYGAVAALRAIADPRLAGQARRRSAFHSQETVSFLAVLVARCRASMGPSL